MEFLKGQSLEQWLKRRRRPTPGQTVRLAHQIATGLHAAHERGLIHRDIKPANIWLQAPDAHVKILDFGLARNRDDMLLTKSGMILGTPAYMAPEQANGEQVDHRCDLFSLGCVMYELCVGQRPFQGDNMLMLLSALAHYNPVPPRDLNPDIPPRVSDLIMRLLAKKPAERIGTANEVVKECKAIMQAMSAASSTPAHPAASVTEKSMTMSTPWPVLGVPPSGPQPPPSGEAPSIGTKDILGKKTEIAPAPQTNNRQAPPEATILAANSHPSTGTIGKTNEAERVGCRLFARSY